MLRKIIYITIGLIGLYSCSYVTEQDRIYAIIGEEIGLKEIQREESWNDFNGDGYKLIEYKVNHKIKVSEEFCKLFNMRYGSGNSIKVLIPNLINKINPTRNQCIFEYYQENEIELILLTEEKLFYFYMLK